MSPLSNLASLFCFQVSQCDCVELSLDLLNIPHTWHPSLSSTEICRRSDIVIPVMSDVADFDSISCVPVSDGSLCLCYRTVSVNSCRLSGSIISILMLEECHCCDATLISFYTPLTSCLLPHVFVFPPLFVSSYHSDTCLQLLLPVFPFRPTFPLLVIEQTRWWTATVLLWSSHIRSSMLRHVFRQMCVCY